MAKISLILAFVCSFAMHDVIKAQGAAAAGGQGNSDFHMDSEALMCGEVNGQKAIEAVRTGIQTTAAVWDQYTKNGKAGKSAKYTWDQALIINDIKAHLGNVIAYYENKPKALANWCNALNPQLNTYKSQKTPGKDSPAKDTLVGSFDTGEWTVYELQHMITISSGIAQEANNELVALKYRIEQSQTDAATKTEQINKIESVRNALKQLLCVETEVDNECNALRAVFGKARVMMLIDDDLADQTLANQAIDNLIAKCNEFAGKPY